MTTQRSHATIASCTTTLLLLLASACTGASPVEVAREQAAAQQPSASVAAPATTTDPDTDEDDEQDAGQEGAGEDDVAETGPPVDTSQFEELQGSTKIGDYALQMPTSVTSTISENSFWPITDYYHVYRDGDRLIVLSVSDQSEHFGDEDDADAQANGAEFTLLDLQFGAGIGGIEAVGEGRPITFTPVGSDGEIIGHELEISRGSQTGLLRFFRKDMIWYSVVTIGLTDAEWTYVSESLRTHYIPAPTAEEIEATAEAEAQSAQDLVDAQATLAEYEDGVPFSEGPFAPRELDPSTGGWDYIHAPPFGALEPGDDAYFDNLWVDCREGDGYACDSLYVESELFSDYEAFGFTCGGRTVNMGCNDLLGSELHPDFFTSYLPDFDFYRTREDGFRLDRIPGPTSLPPGEDTVLDALWVNCGLGNDPEACRELHSENPIIDDVYSAYGRSCGGRRSNRTIPCRALMIDPADRLELGAPAPGTLGDPFDALWDDCAVNAQRCQDFYSMPTSEQRADEAWTEAAEPYYEFVRSCGARYDEPLKQDVCRGGYLDWDVVDNVDELPVPPSEAP